MRGRWCKARGRVAEGGRRLCAQRGRMDGADVTRSSPAPERAVAAIMVKPRTHTHKHNKTPRRAARQLPRHEPQCHGARSYAIIADCTAPTSHTEATQKPHPGRAKPRCSTRPTKLFANCFPFLDSPRCWNRRRIAATAHRRRKSLIAC